ARRRAHEGDRLLDPRLLAPRARQDPPRPRLQGRGGQRTGSDTGRVLRQRIAAHPHRRREAAAFLDVKAHILEEGGIVKETTRADEVRAAHAAGKCLWVDLGDRTPETEALLAETFRIHPLTEEDIWNDRELPKVEDFDEYLYIVGHS